MIFIITKITQRKTQSWFWSSCYERGLIDLPSKHDVEGIRVRPKRSVGHATVVVHEETAVSLISKEHLMMKQNSPPPA